MKIAIVSDTHDNWPNIEKFLVYIDSQDVDLLIHCGDVCAPSTLEIFLKKFTQPIHLCFGNVDGDTEGMIELSDKFTNLEVHGEKGNLEVGGKKIAFIHLPEEAKKLADQQTFDLVFHGHTHKPWEEKTGKTRVVNPGNLANMFYKPTFAIYDTKTDKLELKILEQL